MASLERRLAYLERDAEERWLAAVAVEHGLSLAETRACWEQVCADQRAHPEEGADLVPYARRLAAELGLDPVVAVAAARRFMAE